MKIDVLSLFPEFIESFLSWSIIKKAREKNIFQVNNIDIRDFSLNKHKKVDDYPFGGGPGMLMTPEPIYRAIKSVESEKSKVYYLSPQGKVFNQKKAIEMSREKHIILLAGHYEGIDSRIVSNYVDEEISIGDYVLTGGELPLMVLMDAIIRLLPGVLSSKEAYEEDSHYYGLLEHDQYTRPRDFLGESVPEVLLSGNHKKIEEWKIESSLKNTYKKRPDLIKKVNLNQIELDILKKIKKEL